MATEFKNVMQTYLAMQKSKGLSVEASIKAACEATERKFNKVYLTRWPEQKTPVPDDVVAWMQKESAYFACEMAGARVSKDKAKDIAQFLLIPVKK